MVRSFSCLLMFLPSHYLYKLCITDITFFLLVDLGSVLEVEEEFLRGIKFLFDTFLCSI